MIESFTNLNPKSLNFEQIFPNLLLSLKIELKNISFNVCKNVKFEFPL